MARGLNDDVHRLESLFLDCRVSRVVGASQLLLALDSIKFGSSNLREKKGSSGPISFAFLFSFSNPIGTCFKRSTTHAPHRRQAIEPSNAGYPYPDSGDSQSLNCIALASRSSRDAAQGNP